MGQAIDLQNLGARVIIYADINDPLMNYFNPAIEFHKGKLKIAIRSCNFTTLRHSRWEFLDGNIYSKTDVILGDVNPDTLEVSNLHKLELSEDAPIETRIAGLEDVRLFSRSDGLHAIGFETDRINPAYYNPFSKLAEYIIEDNKLKYIRSLEKPIPSLVEKNWQPTNVPSKKFEFTYSPTQVWKNGEVVGDKYTGQVHGGSQLIKQADGTYLSLVHEKFQDITLGNAYDKYVYVTYLARHDSSGIITQLSQGFRFGTYENIEFAAAMVEYKGDFLISLGIRDCKFAIARINKEKLMSLFEGGRTKW